MADSRKQKLICLGSETLAEALLDLAVYSNAVDDLIEQLIATPKENVQRFKKKLASMIFRSLLISILERGYTKAYPHGIRYLKKLDKLSIFVTDWKDFNHHEAFKEQIIQAHGRKRSFWSKY